MNPMDQDFTHHHYWDLLDQAFDLVRVDDFAAAEAAFLAAERQREASPGRVFLTEKLGDRLRRMLHRNDPASLEADVPGRWLQKSGAFRQEFQLRGDAMVRDGLRLTGLRPEDEAENNQPILARALFLVSRSRLFPAEPRSAVSLLKGIFRTGQKTGRPFDPQLVRHDLPLTEEDRLWLAAKGGDLLDAFREQGNLIPGSPEAEEWARAILQVLRREYFGSSGRLEAERNWLEAVTADRLLQQPGSCVALYRQYLAQDPQPGPRTDEARLRILEILADIDGLHVSIPRYKEALAAMDSGLVTQDRHLTWRLDHARDMINFRQPGLSGTEDLAWASVGVESDGSLGVVFWWDDEPRDIAFWRPGTDAGDLDALLQSCGERIVAWSPEAVRCIAEQWDHPCARYSARGLAAALLEPWLPGGELLPEDWLRLGLGEAEPWRRGWSERLGHPLLAPPTPQPGQDVWRMRPVHQGLLAGLLVLAMRSRLQRSDPSLRAGIRALGRRGDDAAWFVYELVSLGRPAVLALDENFEPWTLPLLWTRSGPWTETDTPAETGAVPDLQPDLQRNNFAIVTTGSCETVMKAWGGSGAKWRMVWDRPARVQGLSALAGGVLGPVTLIPPEGRVHDLSAALSRLDDLLASARGGEPDSVGLMPLFHWLRLVESHNGDLEDYLVIRNRTPEEHDIFAAYHEAIRDLPRVAVQNSASSDDWARQYAQRVRKSGLVAGSGSMLCLDKVVLDARWGVFEGSDASWVFFDSAAVHRALLQEDEAWVQSLHRLLFSRGHRHLSLLTGACWMTEVLDEYLEHLMPAYGRAYRLTLQDRRLPALKLADQGIRPDARLLMEHALAAQVMWLQGQTDSSRLQVLLPRGEPLRRFWEDVARSKVLGIEINAGFLSAESLTEVAGDRYAGQVLVMPELAGLGLGPDADPALLEGNRWSALDTDRQERLEWSVARSALELAGLMAGPWREVVVLDVRWWHLLWGRTREVLTDPGTWSFHTAQTIAGAVAAQPVQLPDPRRARGGPVPAADAVARWLSEHAGHEAHPAPEPDDRGQTGATGNAVILALGPAEQAWQSYVDRLEMGREQGELGTWMLMVAERPDPRWRGVIEREHAPGCSVWNDEGFSQAPAPLVWVTPEQLGRQKLKETLIRRPPAVIHVLDFAAWLPDAGGERHAAAMALRAMIQESRSRCVLYAEQLERPWADFLGALLGERFRIVNADRMVEPAPLPEDPAPAEAACADAQWLLRRLLQGLRPLLTASRGADPGPSGLASAHELVSYAHLAWLSGLTEREAATGIRTLRWALSVCGQHLPAAGGERSAPTDSTTPVPVGPSHAILLGYRYAELEHLLARLKQGLGILVPLWFRGLNAGMRAWIDLEFPPAGIEDDDLVRLDALLGHWGSAKIGYGGLVYRCRPGILNSNRRWVGCEGQVAGLTRELFARLDRLQFQLSELLDAAVETPGGFLVDTGLREPSAAEADFLALGSALGIWRWLGPTGGGAVSLVDILALADAADESGFDAAWRLCSQAMGRPSVPQDSAPQVVEPDEDLRGSSLSALRGLRHLFSGEGRAGQELQQHIMALGASAAERRPGLIVLRGPAGSGRHEALVRGIAQACGGRALPPEVRVFCPDHATAAQVSAEFLRWGRGVDFDLEVPDPGVVLSGKTSRLPAAVSGQVVVLCEAQRFPADLRYKISQLGRGRLLLVTVDPWSSEETWENLFLTAPRPDQVRDFTAQRRCARKIWSEVRGLFSGSEPLPAVTLAAERGVLVAEHAANLDQCLGLLTADPFFNEPQAFLRVVAGVRSDLEYLGMSLGERGWTVAHEDQLEPWLTPGPREFLALLVDLTLSGRDPLFGGLMGRQSQEAWSAWCADHADLLQRENLTDIWQRLQTLDFLQPVMAHGPSRRRVDALLRTWGSGGVTDFVANPLVSAARQIIHRSLNLEPPADRLPTALLAEAAHWPGLWVPSLMYLCLGSEPAPKHYRHWSRVTDALLVLYQERSPVPGAGRL